MSSLNGKTVLTNLQKKGFDDAQHKSADHKYLEFFYDNKLVCHTKLSHGSKKDLGPSLVSQMAKQCKLDKKQFVDFASCKIDQDGYENILDQKGLISKKQVKKN